MVVCRQNNIEKVIEKIKEHVIILSPYLIEVEVSRISDQEYAYLVGHIERVAEWIFMDNVFKKWRNEIDIIIKHESNEDSENDIKKKVVRHDSRGAKANRIQVNNPLLEPKAVKRRTVKSKYLKMKTIKFKQVNTELGKNQKEYITLPCYYEIVKGSVLCGFELSKEEIEQVNKTGKIFIKTLTFGNAFQPIELSTNFDDLYVRSWDLMDAVEREYLDKVLAHNSTTQDEHYRIDLETIPKDHVTKIYRIVRSGYVNAEAGKTQTQLLLSITEMGAKILSTKPEYNG